MIQRIQTIFLLLATTLTLVFCFTDFAFLKINGQEYAFSVFGIKHITPDNIMGISTLPLMLVVLTIAIVSFICIFLFKKRNLQMKLCILGIILLLGAAGLILFHFMTLKPESYSFNWTAGLPALVLIMLFLAYRYIRKDEKLVRSLDRIR